MMKKTILFAVFSAIYLSAASPSWSQNPGPSPTETKLKELVKSLTQRVTQAETDKATLQAEKITGDAKIKELEGTIKSQADSLKTKTEEMSELRTQSAKKEADLNSDLADKKAELEAHKKNLESWRTAHVEISGIAKKKEAERAKQAAMAAALERRVADLRARNGYLFKTGNDILDRHKKFGLGEAIAAREPFTGNMRAKLKAEVQEFADALLDGTADSKRTLPKTDAPAPAPPAAPANTAEAAAKP